MLRTSLEDLLDEKVVDENPEEREFYERLKETFQAYDADGSSQLQFPEYCDAWRFLEQPGDERTMKQAFDSVDVDGNNVVTIEEFVFSIMGEAAMKYGSLADMETINNLLVKAVRAFASLKETLAAAKEDTDSRARRNADLRNQLEDMKRNMDSGMMDLLKEMGELTGIDPSAGLRDEKEVRAHLTKAFDKYDSNKS